MTNTQTQQEDPCPNCTKFGLPILPLRYAVARDDKKISEKAPGLVAPFGDGVREITLPGSVAKYTLRTLRSGYLYVLNDVRGDWKAYEIDEDGALFEFDIRDKSPPPQTTEDDAPKVVCSRHANPPLAKFIMIPDAANAGIVWFAFSDVAWTQEVFKRHQDRRYRKKHMRQVNVATWVAGKGGKTQPHMDALSKVAELVSEYHFVPPVNEANTPEEIAEHERSNASLPQEDRAVLLEKLTIKSYPACDYSPHDFTNCQSDMDAMIAAAGQAGEQWGYPPAMVALADPVGIAMELASMMSFRLDAFMGQPILERPLTMSALLGSLEETIRSNAELDKIKSAQASKVRELEHWRNIPWTTGEGPRDPARYYAETRHYDQLKNNPAYRAEWEAKVADAKQRGADSLTAEDLKKSADKAWGRYQKKLKDGQPQLWSRNIYEPKLKELDKGFITPLANAHNAWLESDALLLYFDGNFDDQSAESGVAFVDAVLLCLQDTQQNAIAFNKYRACLEAARIEPKNYLLRALAYNQKSILDELKAQVPVKGLPLAQLPSVPWKSLIGLYKTSLKDLDDGGNSAIARLVVAMAGPMMKALDTAVDRSVGSLVISMGMMGQAPVTHMKSVGFVADMVDEFVDQLQKEIPALSKVDKALLKQRIEIKSRGGNRTMTPAGKGRWNMQIRFDRFKLGQITEKAAKANPRAVANKAADALMGMGDTLPSNAMARWRVLFSNNFRFGVVQGVLQLWSLNKMADALDGTMGHEAQETGWRFKAGIVGAIGTFASVANEAIEGSQKIGGRLGRAMGGGWSNTLRYAARAAGLFAAAVFAFWDLARAGQEFKEGNPVLGAAYIVSGVAGLGAALLLTGWLKFTVLGLSATGWGLLLAALVLVVGLLIMYFKDDKLQDWVERSFFGKFDAEDRYGTLEDELKEFRLATGQTDKQPEEEEAGMPSGLVPQGG